MESLLRISDAVEVGPSPTGGHGLYARVDLSAGWLFHDHPVCVAEPGSGHRRLPIDIDELMCAVFSKGERRGDPRLADLVSGPFKMTHLARHYEMQDEDVRTSSRPAGRALRPGAAHRAQSGRLAGRGAPGATGQWQTASVAARPLPETDGLRHTYLHSAGDAGPRELFALGWATAAHGTPCTERAPTGPQNRVA